MREFLTKIFNKDVLAIILIGGCLFGLIKYFDYRFSGLEKQVDVNEEKSIASENQYKNDTKDIFDMMLGIQADVANVIEQEKLKNSQFQEITNTVGALEKLSTTDPELLKKYSKVYFLNEHYAPISLSEIPVDYRSEKSTNYQIDSDVLQFLQKLIDAGNADGVSLKALSAYRSFATQLSLKASYKVTYGAGANKFSADQGYSEHQLGTALDFTTLNTKGALEGFDKTPEYEWFLANGYKYGFIISYPSGNTYYKFEPWHWRFVGIALATELHNQNKYFYDADQRMIDNYLVKLFDQQ
jgi:D-alanyl-D-alanine carboxypeptidase